ncbi:hypothetical protein D3C86_2103630 [compost metagenome]
MYNPLCQIQNTSRVQLNSPLTQGGTAVLQLTRQVQHQRAVVRQSSVRIQTRNQLAILG